MRPFEITARNVTDSYTAAGRGGSLRPRANALRCRACRIQLPEFLTGLSILVWTQKLNRRLIFWSQRPQLPLVAAVQLLCPGQYFDGITGHLRSRLRLIFRLSPFLRQAILSIFFQKIGFLKSLCFSMTMYLILPKNGSLQSKKPILFFLKKD